MNCTSIQKCYITDLAWPQTFQTSFSLLIIKIWCIAVLTLNILLSNWSDFDSICCWTVYVFILLERKLWKAILVYQLQCNNKYSYIRWCTMLNCIIYYGCSIVLIKCDAVLSFVCGRKYCSKSTKLDIYYSYLSYLMTVFNFYDWSSGKSLSRKTFET